MPSASTRLARPVLLPAVLGATVLVAGLFLIGSEGYTIVRYAASILALITAVMAVQVHRWPWALPLALIALIWNPVYPFEFEGILWAGAHVLAAATFLAAALLLRTPADPR